MTENGHSPQENTMTTDDERDEIRARKIAEKANATIKWFEKNRAETGKSDSTLLAELITDPATKLMIGFIFNHDDEAFPSVAYIPIKGKIDPFEAFLRDERDLDQEGLVVIKCTCLEEAEAMRMTFGDGRTLDS
jgi:hypothetical protein